MASVFAILMRTFSCRVLSVALAFGCLVLVSAGVLHADDVKYPAETPILKVSVPAGWTSEISKGDLDLTTLDGNVYFSLSKSNNASKLAPMVSAKKFADGAGLTDITVEPNAEENENGVNKKTAFVRGKKDGSNYLAIVGTITMPDGTKCALFVLGEEDAMAVHKKELETIVKSIKAAK